VSTTPSPVTTDTSAVDPARTSQVGRWAAPVGIGLAIALSLGTAFTVSAIRTGHKALSPDLPGAPPASPTPASPSRPTGAAAAGQLVAIADLIEDATTDNTVGRYTYVEINHWSRRDQTEIVPFHEQRWRADDGSGRVITRQLPAIAARTFSLDQIPTTDFSKATAQVDEYRPGEITWGIHGPAPTTPQGMIALLHNGMPGPTPPEVQLDFFTGLYQWDYLGRDSRAAALRALTTIGGLVYDGETTDRAGRAGVAVSLTTTGVRLLLIINPRTGELLASERSVPGFVIDDYTLYLRHDRRPTDSDHL